MAEDGEIEFYVCFVFSIGYHLVPHFKGSVQLFLEALFSFSIGPIPDAFFGVLGLITAFVILWGLLILFLEFVVRMIPDPVKPNGDQ